MIPSPNNLPSQSQHRRSHSISRRPASIAELAEQALQGLWDENKDLKHYLRVAEKYRRDGKEYVKKGDLESAFVEYARAATLVLEKLPAHRDYHSLLTPAQRHNLGLNGQDILDSLSELKPTLVDRYEKWISQQPEPLVDNDRTPDSRQRRMSDPRTGTSNDPERVSGKEREAQEHVRLVNEEVARWRQQREASLRRDEEDRDRAPNQSYVQVDKRREAAVAAARQAASMYKPPNAEYNGNRTPVKPSYGSQNTVVISDGRRSSEDIIRHQMQQEEMRRREEEISRRRLAKAEERRRQEQDGIVRRQQEAEEAARATRQSVGNANGNGTLSVMSSSSSVLSGPDSSPMFPHTTPSSLATTPSSSFYHTPSTAPITYPSVEVSPAPAVRAPTAIKSRPPSFLEQFAGPSIMPLESPVRYEGDSTDSESVINSNYEYRRNGKHKQAIDNSKTPTRAPARSPSYPPPITTTSPPPVEGGRILYPQLMSQHQKRQGYFPSLNSMFGPAEHNQHVTIPPSLLFSGDGKSRSLYSHDILPQPSAPPTQYPYGLQQAPPFPQHNQQYPQHQLAPPPNNQSQQQSQYLGYPGPSRPPPPVPATVSPNQQPQGDRISVAPNPRVDPSPVLKTVNMPRECLPRFLAIAKVNTAMNKETCGLLLGKDKGHKFVVTTLLIPKQHSTSDTCTMDEEELVLQFTEERCLITLGWIHTHPSQSCFMSSVDLHTHSGFQRMLPESFAVVCAPKSNPNFGIFRLTDPPGLRTVLECTVKEAFHPHPDIPIYTDADKGHVQMKDGSLEIIDLR